MRGKILLTALFSAILVPFSGIPSVAQTNFGYTGAVQNYTVPACVYSLKVDLKGASGANSVNNDVGGKGGRVQTTLLVNPGDALRVYVGGKGVYNIGGWNGGGSSGGSDSWGATGGGGASDIRKGGTALSNRILVAGGGGGTGFCSTCSNNVTGGQGGGPGTAGNGFYMNSNHAAAGKGGSQTAGGAAGVDTFKGQPGTLGIGGNGGNLYGGGGGGGYYGGGGGANNICCWGGGGGGGSSFTNPTMTQSTTHTQGFQTGDGQVSITPDPVGPAPPGAMTGKTQACPGDTAAYSITPVHGADSLVWEVPVGTRIDSGQGTRTIYVTLGDSSGNVTVRASNACGTTAPLSKQVNIFAFYPKVSLDTTICPGDSAQLKASGGVFFAWEPTTGLSCWDCPSPWASPDSTTTYKVTIGSLDCPSKVDSVTVTVDCTEGVFLWGGNDFSLFPNPAGKEVWLVQGNPGRSNGSLYYRHSPVQLALTNNLGQIVFEVALHDLDTHFPQRIVLPELSSGLYVFHLRRDKLQWRTQLILQP